MRERIFLFIVQKNMGGEIEVGLKEVGSRITHTREVLRSISREQLQSEIDEIACDLEGFQDQLQMPNIPQKQIDDYNTMISDLEDLTADANIKFQSMFADLSHNLERVGQIDLTTLQEQANKRIQDLQQAIQNNASVEEVQQRMIALETYLASIECAVVPEAQDAYSAVITKATELKQQASSLIQEALGYADETVDDLTQHIEQRYLCTSLSELQPRIAGWTTQIQADIALGTQAGKEAAAAKLQYMHEQLEAAKVQFGESPLVNNLEAQFSSLSSSFSARFSTAFASVAALGSTLRGLSPFVSRTTRALRLEVKNERYGFYGVELELAESAHQAHVEQVTTKIDGEANMQQLSVEVITGPQSMDSLLNYLEASKDMTLDELLAGTPEQQMAGELAYQLSCNAIGGVINKHRKAINPERETKGFDIQTTKNAYAPELTALKDLSGTHLDPHEQRVITLVSEGGVLAGSLTREFSTMKEIEEEGHLKLMSAYNETLGLSPQERTRLQKIGDSITGALATGGNKLKELMRDPMFDGKLDKKDVPLLGLIGGVGLYFAVKNRFSKEDESETETTENEGKGWLRERMWKILGALGLGAVAYGVYKYWDNEKDEKTPNKEIDGTNALVDPVPEDIEAENFHELPPTEVANANLAAQHANKLMMTGTESFGSASYEKVGGEAVSSGVLCAILQKNYGSIGNIISPETYYQLYFGNSLNIFWRMLRNSGQEYIAQVVEGLNSMLPDSGLAGILTSKLRDGNSAIVDQLEVRSAQSDVNQAAVYQVFRKQTGLVAYMYYQREQYKQKLAIQYLTQQHSDRATYDMEKKQTLMDEFISNEGLYATYIVQPLATFDAKPLINLTYARETSALTFLTTVGLLNDQVDLFHQDEYDEMVTELEGLTKDDDEDLLDDAGLFTGESLTEDGEERISQVIENIEVHKDTIGWSRWYEYLGIARFFSHEDDTVSQMEGMYANVMEPLMFQLTIYRQKIVDGEFTPADKLALENTIASYKGYMRQLQLTSYAISEIKEDAEGNLIVTAENIGTAVMQNGANMREGASRIVGALGFYHPSMRFIFNAEQVARMQAPLTRGQKLSEMLKGTAQVGIPMATVFYVTHPMTLIRHAGTAAIKTVSLTMRAGYGAASLASRGMWRGGTFTLGTRRYYKGLDEGARLDKFIYNAVRGWHGYDIDKLVKVAIDNWVKDGGNYIDTVDELMRNMYNNYNTLDEFQQNTFLKHFSNKNIRRQLIRGDIGSRRPYRNHLRAGKVKFMLDPNKLNALAKCDTVVKNLSGNELKVAQHMMSRNILKAEKVITKFPNLSETLLYRHADEVISIFDSMTPRELSLVLQNLENADDLTEILEFLHEARVTAEEAPVVFRNALNKRSSIKDAPMEHLDSLRQPRGIIESLRRTKTAEVFRNLADNLRKRLRNPTLPLDPAGRQMVNEFADVADDLSRNPGIAPDVLSEFTDTSGGTATATRPAVAPSQVSTVSSPQASRIARMKAKIRNMPNGAKLGAILNVVGCAAALYAAGQTQDLADSYEGINQNKVDLYSSKAGNERAMAIVFAGISAGLAMSGVGLPAAIALCLVEVGVTSLAYVANEAYFKTIDAYETNTEERIQQGCEVKQEAKQYIMAIIAGEYDLERSRSEAFARFCKNNNAFFAERADKTISDAMLAWVLLDEVDRSGSELMRATFVGGVGFDDPNITTINENNPDGIDGAEWANQAQLIKDKVRFRIAYITSSVGKTTRTVTDRVKEVDFDPYDTKGDGLTTTYSTVITTHEVLDWPTFLERENTDMQTAFSRLMLESTAASTRQALENNQYPDPCEERENMIALGNELALDPERKRLCSVLFNENREYMVYLASAMSNYIYNLGGLAEEEETLATMKGNEQYMWKYIEYARWYYGWEIPSYIYNDESFNGEITSGDEELQRDGIQPFEHDVTFIRNVALTLDIDTSATAAIAEGDIEKLIPKDEAWMLEHMHTSSSVVQNVLFDIARQVYGMHVLKNDMEALSLIFSEHRKDQHGIYVYKENKEWHIGVNDASGTMYYDRYEKIELSTQLDILNILKRKVEWAIQDEFLVETGSGSGEGLIGRAVGNKYVDIIDTYRNRLRVNDGGEVKPNFASIFFALDVCACDAEGKYFQLPLHVIADAQMLGLREAGEYVYRKTPAGTYEARHIETGEMYKSSDTSVWGWEKMPPRRT